MFPTEGDHVCSWLLQRSPVNIEHCAVAPLQRGPSVPPVPKLSLAEPVLGAIGETESARNVEVAQQASRIKPQPISISTHTPLRCFPAACCLPLYQRQPVSRVPALREKEKKENKQERTVTVHTVRLSLRNTAAEQRSSRGRNNRQEEGREGRGCDSPQREDFFSAGRYSPVLHGKQL
ncbi:unnamed protein product [Pleuronectes platessa]|uniref:Uncharacterized protein n=1 Tax=Pleuronectes platessa TaxID=8262 RepID=A0A9N7UIB3_PLEPL|nr:unnamed protein product [Pleuronectes platessa]